MREAAVSASCLSAKRNCVSVHIPAVSRNSVRSVYVNDVSVLDKHIGAQSVEPRV